jgi:hypothetical protein
MLSAFPLYNVFTSTSKLINYSDLCQKEQESSNITYTFTTWQIGNVLQHKMFVSAKCQFNMGVCDVIVKYVQKDVKDHAFIESDSEIDN